MVEKVTYEGENQKKIERFVLVVYSIYNIAMIVMADGQRWDRWVDYLLFLEMAACWVVQLIQYRTYSFRAKFSAFMIQCSMILNAVYTEKFLDMLPFFLTFVVLFGLYGIAEIIYIAAGSGIIIFCYHMFAQQNILAGSVEDIVFAVVQLGNMLLIENVVYNWTRRNREGSKWLLGAIEELKEVQHSKDDFLANVSHEIRTPINTICGISELLLREDIPKDMQENVLNMQRAGRNLMSAVSDILDFSELQSGEIELEEEAYHITSTINDVINMAMARMNEKHIELIVDCDANIPCGLIGDEKKLRRVIMNLVDNAVKFTEEGCVSIVIGYRKESYGINLMFSIKDTGIGMDEESLEKLFTSFHQVDASRKRQENGLGLGLAISQALVEKMGGAITVKSRKGKGSVVRFVVPQKVLDETPIASVQSGNAVNAATYINLEHFSILTIRDEYTNSIKHMAEQLKTKCHMCRNLAELKRREEKEQFSHIFITPTEYREDTGYFDQLAERTKVVVVLDQQAECDVSNPKLLKILKPIYVMPVVALLNDQYDQPGETGLANAEKFVTQNAHVLVVDDNQMNLQVAQGLLERYRIKVTKAENGRQALEKINSRDYDFVFLDHMMPEMDGVEVLHQIRSKAGEYFRKVPIVALTANTVAGTREMLMQEGFSDFLEKPIERSVLERVLRRNLPPEKIISVEVPNRESQKPEECDTAALWERELEAAGVDVQKGILYCNGREQYVQVLQSFLLECNNSGAQAEKLFRERDWKNYTILVHGIKSAMQSIGALSVSELARQLEFAGREGRIEDILDQHGELMTEYKALFLRLRELKWLSASERVEEGNVESEGDKQEILESEEYPVLEDAVFEQMILQMKEAMYALDGDSLMEMVTELEQYEYHGSPLKASMAQVKRKVEMLDYMSAVEMIVRLQKELAEREGE